MDFDYSTETITPDNAGTITIAGHMAITGLVAPSLGNTIAATGINQAGGKLLTSGNNIVTTGSAGSAQALVLPSTAIIQGSECTIVNDTAITLYVYPPSSGTIDGQLANTEIALPAGGSVCLIATSANGASWITKVGTLYAGTNITLTGTSGGITISAAGGGTSQWTTSTNGIDYTSGNVGIGGAATADAELAIVSTLASVSTSYGTKQVLTAPSGVTRASGSSVTMSTAVGSAVNGLYGVEVLPGTINVAPANHVGVYVGAITGGTNNYGVYSAVVAAANSYNFYAGSTAPNYFNGVVQTNANLLLNVPSSVATPAASQVAVYAKEYGGSGGRVIPAAMGPSGMDYTLQPSMWRQNIGLWRPPGNSTTVPGVFGMNAPTVVGAAVARNVATTNALTRAKRLGYVTAATAGTLVQQYATAAQYTLGTGANIGGFFYSARFGVSDTTLQSVARTFVGMSSSVAAATNVDPATLTNSIGIGHNAADTTWYIYYGGSTAQTRISLGANFPINLTDIIDITLWSPPNQNGVVYYHVTRISAAAQYDVGGVLGPGTAGVTLPANTTLLAPRAWRCNNTAAAVVGLDFISLYLETDW